MSRWLLTPLLFTALPFVVSAHETSLLDRYQRCDVLTLRSPAEIQAQKARLLAEEKRQKKWQIAYPELQKRLNALPPATTNFKDIPARKALELIGENTGMNMIISDEVQGNVTIDITGKSWSLILDTVLMTKGLSMIKKQDVVIIAPSKSIAAYKADAYHVLSVETPVPRMHSASKTKQQAPASTPIPAFGALPLNSATNTEKYGHYEKNPVKRTADEAVSTMSIDVDTGAYANVRRFLKYHHLPPADAVRLEEMVNYFDYHYSLPTDGKPFALNHSVIDSPWKANAKLLRIGLQAKSIDKTDLPPANLAFLLDTSGSMRSENKLGLVKKAVCYFAANLRQKDTISLIAYAGYTQEILPPTAGNEFDRIYNAIEGLSASGSTAGESAIRMGYEAVAKGYNADGINRILLATDGDFNVGISDFEQLKSLVADKRKSGISLTTLGFGTGNYNDQMMEQIADVGDGNYSYIDDLDEAKKVLVEELSSTLATVAKDVKLQIEFNPQTVKEYRLVGYENRVLNNEDFNNDKVDAGDIGAGHNVTAFYEFIPQGKTGWLEDSRYQKAPKSTGNDSASGTAGKAGEYAWLKLRYKPLNSDSSKLLEVPILAQSKPLAQADSNTRFAVAIASFAQALKGGENNGKMTWKAIKKLAEGGQQPDAYHLRQQAIEMIDKAASLSSQ